MKLFLIYYDLIIEVNKMIDQKALNKFNKIYDDSYDYVLKKVICKCSHISDIEDIMQNIYLAVYQSIIKGKEVNKSYILKITDNKINDYYRFKYKDKIISLFAKEDEFDSIPSNIDIESSTIKKYDIEKVWNYLKNKKIIIFKIFILYYNFDLKIKDIAKLLNIKEMTIKNYLYRTLHEINIYLESEGDNNE